MTYDDQDFIHFENSRQIILREMAAQLKRMAVKIVELSVKVDSLELEITALKRR